MKTTAVTVAPWCKQALGKVTKTALKAHFKVRDGLEFLTIGDMFGTRAGMTLTTREAGNAGIEMLEVREGDRLVAALYLHRHPSGNVHVEVK